MIINAKSDDAIVAKNMVVELQTYFVEKLNKVSIELGNNKIFEAIEWERDSGIHGGGVRYEARDEQLFNRGSVNISQVHYDEDKTKKLSSATAISVIIHPENPHVPSVHMHISWTQMSNEEGYWRIMGDLNPSHKNDIFQNNFEITLKKTTGKYYDNGKAQGDRYFNIPVLNRKRGVSHFYLENFNTGDFNADKIFAEDIGKSIIDTYIEIILQALQHNKCYTTEEKSIQLDYHTLYLFQVLTLDKGTTSGLLVHDQNDVGIMGSIPSHINKQLLVTWVKNMIKPQDKLLLDIINVLSDQIPTPIDIDTKKKLARVVREHYKTYPAALTMQASGEIIPTTRANHT